MELGEGALNQQCLVAFKTKIDNTRIPSDYLQGLCMNQLPKGYILF